MKKINILRLSIVITSIIFIIYGISNGELTSILRKSINICLECIGIG